MVERLLAFVEGSLTQDLIFRVLNFLTLYMQGAYKMVHEKSVGTTVLQYSTKKREHSLNILRSFFRLTFIRV